MNRIKFSIIIILFSLFSCNIGKHYANMRIHQEPVSCKDSVKCHYENANYEKEKTISYDDDEIANTVLTSANPTLSNKNLSPEKQNEDFITASENKRPDFLISEKNSIIPAPQNSGPPSSGQLLLAALVFLLLLLIALGLLIFLIAWIFTTAVLALKFALWALLILVVGYLLVALIFNLVDWLFF